MIIAIDGPAGSGKSTIAKLIADDLGLVYLDTGAMYRLVTLKALNDGILGNLEKIEEMLNNLNIDIRGNRFYLDDIDVSEEIRKPVVSENVSDIAVIREVREKMVDLQRKLSKSKSVILDGRDIGTVVLKDAEVKIYMTATPMARAKRRYDQNIAKNIPTGSIEEIAREIAERDLQDMTRENSPLKKADDAVEIDTSDMSIDEVTEYIYSLAKPFIEKEVL